MELRSTRLTCKLLSMTLTILPCQVYRVVAAKTSTPLPFTTPTGLCKRNKCTNLNVVELHAGLIMNYFYTPLISSSESFRLLDPAQDLLFDYSANICLFTERIKCLLKLVVFAYTCHQLDTHTHTPFQKRRATTADDDEHSYRMHCQCSNL